MSSTLLLSYPISMVTPLYGNGEGIQLLKDKSLMNGDNCNTMQWSFPNHTGTHVDVPYHFNQDGKKVTDNPPSYWIFEFVAIVDLSGVISEKEIIGASHISDLRVKDPDLLLLSAGFGQFQGSEK
jgi:arylformamidase